MISLENLITLLAIVLWVGLKDMSLVFTPEPYIANGGCFLGSCLADLRLRADAERRKS